MVIDKEAIRRRISAALSIKAGDMGIMKRDALAQCGINRKVIYKCSNDTGFYPSLPTLVKVSRFCGVSIDWLVYGEE